MIEDSESASITSRPDSDTDSSLRFIDVLSALALNKKSILISVFGVMLCTAGTSFLLTKKFKSDAVVLLPERSGILLDALSSGSGSDLGSIGANLLGAGASGNLNRCMAILNSRKLREDLINHFGLLEAYGVEKMEDALEIVDKNLTTESDRKLGTITITFRFQDDEKITAEMTNFIVAKLDDINRELSTEQARSTRKFIEERHNEARAELQSYEDSLNAFQNAFGIISIPDQLRAGIDAAAQLQTQLVTEEIQYNVKKNILAADHPDLLRLRSEIKELRRTQAQMERGDVEMGVFIPFNNAPDLGLRYYRLFRNVQISEKIVGFLVPQYEQAKIQEARDTPTLLILDKAKPADYPYWPRKKVLTLLAGLITAILMTTFHYVRLFIWNKYKSDNREFITVLSSFKPKNWK